VYQSKRALSTLCPNPAALVLLGRSWIKPGVPHVWLLHGSLGAGKTTLIRGLLRALGVRARVTSPTFNLVRQYQLHRQPWRLAVHIDAYRIKGCEEIRALELPEITNDPAVLVLVEWPENIPGWSWGPALSFNLRHHRDGRLARVKIVS